MTEQERDALRRREIEALERLANRPAPTQRTWKDVFYGVPVGQEHMREHYYSQSMRVRY